MSHLMAIFIVLFVYEADGGSSERRLLNDLLQFYNSLERPVFNESEAVELQLGLTLQQIIDVDEKNQIMTTNVWLNLEWTDINLIWNKTEYGDIGDIRIPPKYIWKPDLLMYNSADEKFDGTFPTNVVVTDEGGCTYIPPGIFKSTCQIDITWFPFDDQNCDMKFGSWTYDGFKLNLTLKSDSGADTSTFVMNGEWDLLGVPAIRNAVRYDCCPAPYLDITFTIIIRRRTLYYFFNLIVPCILIASMAVLGFTLPPDSGEKLSLGVTILLSLTIFLNTVSEIIPITSDSPLIGTYFNCIMFMVASSVVTTIMILNYHHRRPDTHDMPDWVRVIFLNWIPWLLLMNRPGHPLSLKSLMMKRTLRELPASSDSKSLLVKALDMEVDNLKAKDASSYPKSPITFTPLSPKFHISQAALCPGANHNFPPQMARTYPDRPVSLTPGHDNGGGHHSATTPTSSSSHHSRELALILKEIKIITDTIRASEETMLVVSDWKYAAIVLDRLCLMAFTLFTLIATVVLFSAAPHILVT